MRYEIYREEEHQKDLEERREYNRRIDQKIERIKAARRKLYEINDDISSIRTDIIKKTEEGSAWTGSHYNEYRDSGLSYVAGEYDRYLLKLYSIIEALNAEQRKLQNLKK